jgi:hypothetical protein
LAAKKAHIREKSSADMQERKPKQRDTRYLVSTGRQEGTPVMPEMPECSTNHPPRGIFSIGSPNAEDPF